MCHYGDMHPDLMTSPQAAQLLGCSARTVHRLILRGTLKPAMRLDTGPNGAFLFKRSDVERLAKAREAKAAQAKSVTNSTAA